MAKSSIRAAIAVVWVLCCQLGLAQEAPSLRGIRLGDDLAAVFKLCPALKPKYVSDRPTAMFMDEDQAAATGVCFSIESPREPFVGSNALVVNLPLMPGLGRWAGIVQTEGKVEQVELVFLAANYALMLESLRERFGMPTRQGVEDFQNGFGAMTSGQSATWSIGDNLLVIDQHRSGAKDYGYITLSSGGYLRRLSQQRIDAKQSIAKSL